MKSARRLLALSFVACVCLLSVTSRARELSVVDMLGRYASGKFDAVVAELSGDLDFEEILKQLKRDGPIWIEAAGLDHREKRELVAATFALEAARADAWHEWKWVVKQPEMNVMTPPDGARAVASPPYQPLNVLYWRPPPLLIEWACKVLSQRETPRPIERWWQLAALAVAQRSEDPAFLVGDPSIGQNVEAGEIINLQHEIKHLDHVMKRFPGERRFMLGQGIARDRMWQDDATQAYGSLLNDPDIGGEATMRMGAMLLRRRQAAEALKLFDRVESLTRDPYVVYLSFFFSASALEQQGRHDDAQAAYRWAAATIPHAQSATIPLAASYLREGRRDEAHTLIGSMMSADPRPLDPWRAYVHADDRFWPYLLGKLRAEILK